MKELDEKGFVFIGANGHPYLCAMYHGFPMLFYWHKHDKTWVTYRRLNQSEIWQLPHNLTEEQQQYYHDLHQKWMDEHKAIFGDDGE